MLPRQTRPFASVFQYGAFFRRVSVLGRRFSASARTNNSRPWIMKTSAGWGYIFPFRFLVFGSPLPKNISRRCAGLHHAINPGVLARTFSGRTSAAMLAPRPFRSVSRKPVVTDWPAHKYGASLGRCFTSCNVANALLPSCKEARLVSARRFGYLQFARGHP